MSTFTVHDVEQRSEAWLTLRAGRVCGSMADTMLTKFGRGGKGESVGRRDLRIRLACERLLQRSLDDGYVSFDMRRGIEKERDAIAAYEAATGSVIRRTGYLAHNLLPVGCSLDGHVGDFLATCQIKAPKTATHLEYLRIKKLDDVPVEYVRQMTHELFCVPTAAYADFVSFDDRVPEPIQLVRFRIYREQLDLAAYELELRLFLSEIEKELAKFEDLIAERMAA